MLAVGVVGAVGVAIGVDALATVLKVTCHGCFCIQFQLKGIFGIKCITVLY